MFSVRATTRPLRRTVATVSRPSATSSMASSPSSVAGTAKVVRYSQARSSIHCSPSSFVPKNGSGICLFRRRSLCTQPGTRAARQGDFFVASRNSQEAEARGRSRMEEGGGGRRCGSCGVGGESGRGLELRAVLADDVAVPVVRILGRAFLRLVVDVDQAEAILVAFAPLEVVEDGPVEVAGDRDALGGGALEAAEVAREEVDALRVVDLAVEVDEVRVAEAVFRKNDRELVALGLEARRPVQRLRGDLQPGERAARVADAPVFRGLLGVALRVGADAPAGVAIVGEVIDFLGDEFHVPGLDLGQVGGMGLEAVGRVLAEQDRVG